MMLFVDFMRCVVYPLTALVITVVNTAEIWFIKNRYRRTVNPLLVFVKTLSVVDLLIGVNFFVKVLLGMLETHLFNTSTTMMEVEALFRLLIGRLLFGMSVFVLVVFAVVRMLTITKNKRFLKSKAQNMCRWVWLIALLAFVPEYVLCRLGIISEEDAKYRDLSFPIITYSAILIFIYCFTNIFLTLKKSNKRLMGHKTSINRARKYQLRQWKKVETSFTKIGAFSLAACVLCWSPLATYSILCIQGFGASDDRHLQIVYVTRVLAAWNSVFNSIIFFAMYKPAHRRKSRQKHCFQIAENRESFARRRQGILSELEEGETGETTKSGVVSIYNESTARVRHETSIQQNPSLIQQTARAPIKIQGLDSIDMCSETVELSLRFQRDTGLRFQDSDGAGSKSFENSLRFQGQAARSMRHQAGRKRSVGFLLERSIKIQERLQAGVILKTQTSRSKDETKVRSNLSSNAKMSLPCCSWGNSGCTNDSSNSIWYLSRFCEDLLDMNPGVEEIKSNKKTSATNQNTKNNQKRSARLWSI